VLLSRRPVRRAVQATRRAACVRAGTRPRAGVPLRVVPV